MREADPNPTWLAALAVCALPAANLFLFGPHTVYARNLDEFGQGFAAYAPTLLTLTATLALLATLGVRVLPAALGSRALTFVFCLGLLTWIQGNWLLSNYGLLDGSPLTLSAGVFGVWELVLWIAVIVVAQGLHARAWRHWPFVALVLIAVQAMGMVLAGTGAAEMTSADGQGDGSDDGSGDVLDPSMLGFSADRNLIVLIHDTFTTDMFLDTRERDPRGFEDAWEGFTVYRDALGVFPTTATSVAAMLGLPVFDNSVPMQDYKDGVFRSPSVLDHFRERSIPVDWIAPGPYFCRETRTTSCFAVPHVYASPAAIRRDRALQLVDVSLFRQVPHTLKPAVYRDGRWLVQGLAADADTPTGKPASGVAIFDDVIAGMHVDRRGTTLKIIHLAGGHAPLVLGPGCEFVEAGDANAVNTARQLDCSLLQTGAFLDRLDELGLFDDALVVLMGDHGSSFGAPDVPGHLLDTEALSRARTLVAVKWPGRRGPPVLSDAPVSLGDLAPTLAAAAGVEADLPGYDMAALDEDTRRTRSFGLYTLRARAEVVDGYLRRLERFACDGRSTDPLAWRLVASVFPPRLRLPAGRIALGDDAAADHVSYHGWGAIRTDGSQRWRAVRGRFASVYATRPAGGATRVRVRLRGAGEVVLGLDGRPGAHWSATADWSVQEALLPQVIGEPRHPAISTWTLTPSGPLDVDWIEILPAD